MARNPKIEHVKAKVRTRGDIKEVGIRHMLRLQPVVHHMHEVLRLHASDDASIRTGINQYIIALACHLETFFRDIFRWTIERDSSYFERIVQFYRLRLPADHDLKTEGVNRYDFVAEALTLQSAGSIFDALDLFFSPNRFSSTIESSRMVYAIPSKGGIANGFPLSAFPSWEHDFKQIFELRHELAHDANSTLGIDRSKIARLESLAIFLPQYVTLMICLNMQPVVHNDADTFPVIFLVEDLLAKDWVVLE